MYERMSDKEHQPSPEELEAYCGEGKERFRQLCEYLSREIGTEGVLRFPYGKHYGWGLKYAVKQKHICDVFAERGAFTVMLRLSNQQYARVYDHMTDDTKAYIEQKYPCGDGGWIHYRVLNEQHLADVKELLRVKLGR